MGRIERERKTISAMIAIYCHLRHKSRDAVCPACFELLEYAHDRLQKCPYEDEKTSCKVCPTHCYSQTMKERIKEVMRFSGPRMFFRHPILAAQHYMDERVNV